MGILKNMKLKIGVGLALALGAAAAAFGAGSFQTLPILGGAAYCASYIGSPTSQGTITGTGGGTTIPPSVCQQPVPAGPSWWTGGEVGVADIYTPGTGPQFNGGAQTVAFSLPNNVNLGGITVVTTGTSGTIPNATSNYVLSGVGATFAVTMPASPVNNQVVRISNNSSTAIATFSVAANTTVTSTQALSNGVAPTNLAAMAANTAATALADVIYIYQASSTTWFRIQ